MARSTYTREDVEQRYAQRYERWNPAVNVKVYAGPREAWRDWAKYQPDADPRFSEEWVEENVSEETLDALFWHNCEWNWEQIETDAEDIFGKGTTVQREGRSGGWAVVTNLPYLEEWDAIMLGKWRKFERLAKAIAADIPYTVLDSLYCNEFEIWKDEESERLGAEAFAPEALS